ncbi:hypothetical protein HHL26_06860 [Sphingobium sp. TB-6]|nr:hypothetical protein [Sphingobium sp. TB-6]NML88787.1 hypothetical protein [Sphingobium sp. TB-6]
MALPNIYQVTMVAMPLVFGSIALTVAKWQGRKLDALLAKGRAEQQRTGE